MNNIQKNPKSVIPTYNISFFEIYKYKILLLKIYKNK